MKLQSTIKYQVFELRRSLLIFYSIMLSILLLSTFSLMNFSSGVVEIRGTDMASMIFIFIVGLNSFRENFLFSQANGVSRKTQFKGFIVAILLMASFMAIIDMLYTHLFSSVIPYLSFFSMIYGPSYLMNSAPFPQMFDGLLWSFFLYAMFAMLGYFVNLVFYRSGLIMKLIVSIVPPIFILIVLPYLAYINPILSRWILDFTSMALGLSGTPNAYSAMLTFAIAFIIFAGGSFLLIRRAPIK